MEHVHANLSVSVTELKKNPTALLKKSNGRPVAILNHNKPAAYLIPADVYAIMLDVLEDHDLSELVKERMKEKNRAITVTLDDI